MSNAVGAKLDKLEALGVSIKIEGSEAKFRYPSNYTEVIKPILNDLRLDREAVVQILQQRRASYGGLSEEQGWSRRSIALAERFDRPFMRLLPLVGRRVSTPKGPGKLEHVLGKVARVVLDADPTRMADFDWEEILPLPV
jgi:hypothetical protein